MISQQRWLVEKHQNSYSKFALCFCSHMADTVKLKWFQRFVASFSRCVCSKQTFGWRRCSWNTSPFPSLASAIEWSNSHSQSFQRVQMLIKVRNIHIQLTKKHVNLTQEHPNQSVKHQNCENAKTVTSVNAHLSILMLSILMKVQKTLFLEKN